MIDYYEVDEISIYIVCFIQSQINIGVTGLSTVRLLSFLRTRSNGYESRAR